MDTGRNVFALSHRQNAFRGPADRRGAAADW
jgi:hypothetical protein